MGAADTQRLDLVFLWHMHQPDYRDRVSGEFALPWTLLHALKDYTDMVAHLERHPGIHAVVNFVPVLLEQIEDYLDQFATASYRDPLLRLLARDELDTLNAADRRLLLDTCFRCHHPTMLIPFPFYRRLQELHDQLTHEGEAALSYLSGAYCADLLTWYFIAWSGETERRREPLLAELMARGEGFGPTERRQLLDLTGRTLARLLPRYRALQERGQIEISTTPHAHPLAPLLLDFAVAREAQPKAPLPQASAYPGGRSRVERHLQRASEWHQRHFGRAPTGMWPAEGALSADFVRMMDVAGVRWAASGGNVLNNCLGPQAQGRPNNPHVPWHLNGTSDITLFFRDDRLSDLIGFEYAKWHGRDAAAHFVAQLEAVANEVAAAPTGQTPVVSVILDGENAWEYYPYNGYYFFDDLYALLEKHPTIRTRTYAEVLDAAATPAVELPRFTAGSWVHGTLATWIGDAAKNHAWDLLCAAKQSYDQVIASGRLTAEEVAAAESQLAVCESSDWFWWFGDYNPAPAVASFDRLYRHNLANLYRRLHLTPPAQLDLPISSGRTDGQGIDAGGTMRRAATPNS